MPDSAPAFMEHSVWRGPTHVIKKEVTKETDQMLIWGWGIGWPGTCSWRREV